MAGFQGILEGTFSILPNGILVLYDAGEIEDDSPSVVDNVKHPLGKGRIVVVHRETIECYGKGLVAGLNFFNESIYPLAKGIKPGVALLDRVGAHCKGIGAPIRMGRDRQRHQGTGGYYDLHSFHGLSLRSYPAWCRACCQTIITAVRNVGDC